MRKPSQRVMTVFVVVLVVRVSAFLTEKYNSRQVLVIGGWKSKNDILVLMLLSYIEPVVESLNANLNTFSPIAPQKESGFEE